MKTYMVEPEKYMDNLIGKIYKAGYQLYMVKGQKVIKTYWCSHCRKKTLVKAYRTIHTIEGKYKKTDTDSWNVCKCGYRSKF